MTYVGTTDADYDFDNWYSRMISTDAFTQATTAPSTLYTVEEFKAKYLFGAPISTIQDLIRQHLPEYAI